MKPRAAANRRALLAKLTILVLATPSVPISAQIDQAAMNAITSTAKDACARPLQYGRARTREGAVGGSFSVSALLNNMLSLGVSAERKDKQEDYSGVERRQLAAGLADYNRCVQNLISYLSRTFYTRPSEFSARSIWFENRCDENIKLLISYRELSGQWVTRGWYHIDGGKHTFLTYNDQRLKTPNRWIYIYAVSELDGGTWSGDADDPKDRWTEYEGTRYLMDGLNTSADADGDLPIFVSCD